LHHNKRFAVVELLGRTQFCDSGPSTLLARPSLKKVLATPTEIIFDTFQQLRRSYPRGYAWPALVEACSYVINHSAISLCNTSGRSLQLRLVVRSQWQSRWRSTSPSCLALNANLSLATRKIS